MGGEPVAWRGCGCDEVRRNRLVAWSSLFSPRLGSISQYNSGYLASLRRWAAQDIDVSGTTRLAGDVAGQGKKGSNLTVVRAHLALFLPKTLVYARPQRSSPVVNYRSE